MTLRASLVVFFAAAALCFAQSERGAITGVVTDATNAAVPNAPVKVINTGTNAVTSVVASSSGEYSAANLPPGTYRLEVTPCTGFQSAVVETTCTLTAGATVRADVRLQVGGVTQTVEVQSQNAQIQTEDAKISTAVSNTLVDQLPLVVGGAMRSPFDLVTTVPEAKDGTNLSLGGGQGGAFAATFDGVSVNTNRQGNTTETSYLTPSLEAITEFAVDTNGFKAEYGQAGGGVISFASKSGTNELHGSAYDFIRNDYVDARGFFARHQGRLPAERFRRLAGRPRLDSRRSITAATAPSSLSAYEGFRNRQGSPGSHLDVPTPEMYQGNFSNWVNSSNRCSRFMTRPRRAPTRTAPARSAIRSPGNIIPVSTSARSPTSTWRIAKSVLLPNRPGIVPGTIGYVSQNYISGGGSSAESTTKFSVKIDHAIGSKHHLSYLFNRGSDLVQPGASGPAGLPMPFNGFSQSSFDADLHRATYDWTALAAHVQPLLARHQHVQQRRLFGQRRQELEKQGLHHQRRRLQREPGQRLLRRALLVGRRRR